MLERSWQMVRHNEIPSTTRHAVLMAATEVLWRMVNGQT
ncbi:TetR family transcriptional regulator [Mycobacterium tuberculosis]|nr:TetR family transcriptional regulator [Mycobacterium tuberculosis]